MSTESGDKAEHQGRSTEELREDIARRRSELGDTVEALVARADIRTRAKERADRLRTELAGQARRRVHAARERAGGITGRGRRTAARQEVQPNTRAAMAAAVITAVVAAGWLRRRARRRGRCA